jgi:hypothetical protein
MFGGTHRSYTPHVLPDALADRMKWFVADTFEGWRLGMLPFLAIGLVAMSIEVGIGVASCLALFVAYLWYSHDSHYSIYYMEAQPMVALVVALGVCAIARTVGARWGRRLSGELPTDTGRRVAGWCAVILLLVAIRPTRDALKAVRKGHEIGDLPHRMFRSAVDTLPSARSVVFVHYLPGEGCGQNLIENEPPLRTARAWIVYDRGAENQALLRLAPDRTPYIFDTKAWQLRPYGALPEGDSPQSRPQGASDAGENR